MGEVYRARDTRLAREVAIKILAPRIASDRDAVVRFEREARALAALNHPNIAAIYDVVESGGQPALVLELVEGDTLADRIAAGRVPVDTALDYARQIADGLDAAHEAGIVHRDLKPGNIKITDEGRIKVLDFGLAKAVAIAAGQLPDADPMNSPTITVHGISQNVILGTAAYMSPEQARGRRIDKRTDIWAFGCVLFEMLTGTRAFNGETTSDVIAAIIERPVDLSALPSSTPTHVRRVIARCLEKDPKRRARDIADVRDAVDDRVAAPAAPAWRWKAAFAGLAAVALVAIGIGALSWRRGTVPAAPVDPIEFVFSAPPGYTLAPVRSTLSPDGRHIAFIARDDKTSFVFLRSLEALAPRRLDGTAEVINHAYWSPDSQSIAFLANGAWKRVGIEDGAVVTIVPNIAANLGASWGPGDVFLFATSNRTALSRVAISGGRVEEATSLDAQTENSHRWPQWLPDGRHFLFTVRSDRPENLGIKIGAIGSSEVRALVNVASPGVYAQPGYLLFMTPDQALMAQRVDSATWTLQGTAQPLAGRVRYNGPSFNGMFDASLDGRVITYAQSSGEAATLEWFDRTGKPLGRVGPERNYRTIRLAPDGKHLAVELADEQVGTRDLWLIDTVTNAMSRLTSSPATDWRAAFSPDSASIVFASDRAGASTVFRALASGTGAASVLYRSPTGGAFPADWSRDGKFILVNLDDRGGRNEALAQLPATGGEAVRLVEHEPGSVIQPRYSPSGDRIAYVTREGGVEDVYVLNVSDRRRVRVSTEGGRNPVWGPDGRELFYQSLRDEVMRVIVDGMSVALRPQMLFRSCAGVNRTLGSADAEMPFDISPDGTRFLMNCAPPDAVPSSIHVVVNWQSRLK